MPPTVVTDDLLGTVTRYIRFSPADQALLAAFGPLAQPYVRGLVERFYARVTEFADAAAVITGGDEQIARLEDTLVDWLETGLAGPHDHAYFVKRHRIGWVHVKIGLPQHYMVTAINVLRIDMREVVDRVVDDPARRRRLDNALDRLLDLELAIMLDAYRTASNDRLQRRERLATIGQLAATIAHDLRDPLSVAQSSAYLLRRRLGDDEAARRHLDRIESQLDRSSAIISDLLEVVRGRPPKTRIVEAATFLRDVVRDTPRPAHVQVEVQVEPGLVLAVDVGLLRQAIVNLLTNAFDALDPRPGHVWLRATAAEGERVVFCVEDDGDGFVPDLLASVFEPLVTTRAQGTGLGLALVESVAARHGGRAEAGNRPEGGAWVRISLPRGAVPT